MFLNAIKSFRLNKNLKNKLSNVKGESLDNAIVTVGLIVDENHFLETNALKQEIVRYGIAEDNIKIIAYRDVVRNKEVYLQPTFSLENINSKGEFTQEEINEFISDKFDLLISYYNEEKPFLLFLTNNSVAKFKVGFSTVDKRLNHILFNIDIENYKDFINELFRYLKILNKI